MIIRLNLSVIGGILVTLALFYLMQALISGAKSALTEDKVGNLVDFVRVKEEQSVETKTRKPPKPPPPDEPPPDVPPENFKVNVDDAGFSMSDVVLEVGADVKGGGFGFTDGDYLPIVKVQPQYPRRALARGMSGYVILEFTVTAQGLVEDPVVVENCGWIKTPRTEGECRDKPNTVFDSAAKKAALKFKYKPKVIDGQSVATSGVQNKITFEIDEDGGR